MHVFTLLSNSTFVSINDSGRNTEGFANILDVAFLVTFK